MSFRPDIHPLERCWHRCACLFVLSFRSPKSAGRLTNEPRGIVPQLHMHGRSIVFEKTRAIRLITFNDKSPQKENRHT